jgi:N-acetylglutamate synthase-like GNAT family acetyltransferase
MKIRQLTIDDINNVKDFTDQWIGQGYYSLDQLRQAIELSSESELNCSFVALDELEKMIALRLTFAPTPHWQTSKCLSFDKWEVDPSQVAYFKSLFVCEQYQGSGLGRQLSEASLAVIKELGGKAVVCHSWLESPNNSSQRYLEKMGFKSLKNWPEFWKEIDYSCTRCGKPCLCTGSEMIKYL